MYSSSSSAAAATFIHRDANRRPTPRTILSLEQKNSSVSGCLCRSNRTHIVWQNGSMKSDCRGCTCILQTIQEAKYDSYQYLRRNIMAFDQPFLCTMGFCENYTSLSDVDGLLTGLIGTIIDLSLQAKIEFTYTDLLPRPIFMEFILNYANLNECRTNIRGLLWKRLIQPLFISPPNDLSNHTVADVVRIINTKMWRMLAPSHTDCITFVSGQTPLIFDPMSVLSFGYGSCTGLSILLVQALRAAGIPARIAGTAAWNQNAEHGNHNWVEIWIPSNYYGIHNSDDELKDDFVYRGSWLFLEASPNQTVVDNIEDWSPCRRWFCVPSRMENGTQFFASKLESSSGNVHFPMAWEIQNVDVPAVNRTSYYQSVCSKCQ